MHELTVSLKGLNQDQLDDNEKLISKLQEENVRIVQELRKRKLKPL